MGETTLDDRRSPGTPPHHLFTGTLADHLGEDFRGRRLGRQLVHADLGAATTRPLLTWQALNEILATRRLTGPQLRLYLQGSPVPPEDYARILNGGATRREIPRPDRLYAVLRQGASLIIDAVETIHPPVAAAAEDLMRFVREPVQVNLYLTWGHSRGFDPHWDDHDTFVVQIAGTKHWTVHGSGRPFPMTRDVTHDHTCPEAVIWQGELAPGHVLHVPRGWWHAVRGAGDLSLHLTFGFTRATGVDWACWVADQLRRHQIFRRDLPRFASEQVRKSHRRELLTRLEEALSSHGPDEYLAARDRRVPRRQAFSLPHAIDFAEPDLETVVSFTPVLPPSISTCDGRTTLTTGGRTFTFAPVMALVLRPLAARRAVSCRELRELSGLDPDTFATALEVLCEQHLITLTHPPSGPDSRG